MAAYGKDATSLYETVLGRKAGEGDGGAATLQAWQANIDKYGYDQTLAWFRNDPNVSKYSLTQDQIFQNDYSRIANAGNTDRIGELTSLFDKVTTQAADANESFLSGEVPDSVAQMLFTRAAEKGLKAGVGSSSQFAENIGLRDLGIYATEAVQQGIANANNIATSVAAATEAERNYHLNIQNTMASFKQLDLTADQLRLNQDQFESGQVAAVNNLVATINQNMYTIIAQMTYYGAADYITELTQTTSDITTDLKALLGNSEEA